MKTKLLTTNRMRSLTNLQAPFAVFNPALTSKVGRLCTVETMIESRVVAVRKGDDDLTSFLYNRVHRNRKSFEYFGRY